MGGLRASAVAVVVFSILWDSSDAFACCAAPGNCKRIPVAPVAAAAAVTGSGEGVTTPPLQVVVDLSAVCAVMLLLLLLWNLERCREKPCLVYCMRHITISTLALLIRVI